MQKPDGDLVGHWDSVWVPLTPLQPASLLAILSISNIFAPIASGQA